MPFLDSLDIANRALDHLGQPSIDSVSENSKANKLAARCYDTLRIAELERNTWRFSTRRVLLRPLDTTTYFLDPDDWSAGTTYLPGSIVKDDNGDLWYSTIKENLNNAPGSTSAWDKYFGPLSVSAYDTGTSYWSGELVYSAVGNGSYVIFMSLLTGNTDNPATATAYDATVTYKRDDTVSYGGFQWYSRIELNKGNTPAEAPTAFDITATYAAADQVTGSDGFIYTSIGSGNVGHDPTASNSATYWTATGLPAAWSKTPTIYASSIKWRPVFSAMSSQQIYYPLGTGPSTQMSTRNVYRLPAGYLKHAPQDPRAGSISRLGAPTNLPYDDWEFEGDYIVSADTNPLMLRFVADIEDVTKMSTMFCEGLACRMATEMCEPLTQSDAKLQTLASQYKYFMGEARLVNAIEIGADEAPLDDYIACRS